MKIILFLMIFCIAASLCYAEAETLLDGAVDYGYYAGAVVKLTQYNDDLDVLRGGRVGWIFNNSYAVGLSGYGMMSGSHMHGHGFNTGNGHSNRLAYGGVEFEHILKPDKLIHYSYSFLLGAGNLRTDDHDEFDEESYSHDHESNTMLIFEPGIACIVNINPWLRIGTGLSYRIVNFEDSGVDEASGTNGLSALLQLNFGRF